MTDKFFYSYNPAIKGIFNKIIYGRGSKSDFKEISKSFILEGFPILQTEEDYQIDDSIAYLNKKKCYVARKAGFVYFNEKDIKILPFIGVNEEKLFSYIIIPSKEFTKSTLKLEVIYDYIDSYSFKNLIDEDLIKECMRLHNEGGGYKIIYQGTPMIPDRIDDILFDKKFNFVNKDFDFFKERKHLSLEEIKIYYLVKKGEYIGGFKDIIPGKDGEDVFGHPIVRCRVNSYYQIGGGLEKKDNGDIVALEEGVLRINTDRKLTVRKTQIINDEIKTDLKINTKKDVIITGRIYSNTAISLKGSLVVIGSVEKINIDCGQDLFITNGINNRSVIKTGGDCIVQFIANSGVTSNGKVIVGQYALNSNIKAYEDIIVKTNQLGEIVGGQIESEQGDIETNSVGSVSGTNTFLKVGSDTIRVELGKSNKTILEELTKEKFFIEQKMIKIRPRVSALYKRIQEDPQSVVKFEEEQFKKNIIVLKKLKDEEKVLDDKIKEIKTLISRSERLKNNQNQIRIYNEVFGGVNVQIKNIKYFFKYNIHRGLILKKHPVLSEIQSYSLVEGEDKSVLLHGVVNQSF